MKWVSELNHSYMWYVQNSNNAADPAINAQHPCGFLVHTDAQAPWIRGVAQISGSETRTCQQRKAQCALA